MMTASRVSAACAAAALTILTLSACQSGTKSESVSSAPATTSSASSTASTSASATTSTSATTSASAKPAGDKVGSADLPGVVSDRTYRGADGAQSYSEYYAPDGTVRGKSAAETYSGTWKVVGEQLCFDYSYADPSKNETACYDVFKNGDVISWVDSNGVLEETALIEGNPDGL